MSKYDPLFLHLSGSTGAVDLSFEDVEELLGFQLPRSARRHAAWWSNSGGTHVQSASWQAAGYRTARVNIEQGTVRFVPEHSGGFGEMKQPYYKPGKSSESAAASKPDNSTGHHPAYGALKGLITIPPEVDLTKPAFDDWKILYGEE